jgi:hypothetical protein
MDVVKIVVGGGAVHVLAVVLEGLHPLEGLMRVNTFQPQT